MGFVHTAYGPGKIVAEENLGRGNRQYKVEGQGFSVWIDASKITAGDDEGGPGHHVDTSNSVALPYNPEPQYDAIAQDTYSTLQPVQSIDADQRTHPADSMSFNEVSHDESDPGIERNFVSYNNQKDIDQDEDDYNAYSNRHDWDGDEDRHSHPEWDKKSSLFERPAGLDPKYAFPDAPVDRTDPVYRFQSDPIAYINRIGNLHTGSLDPDTGDYQLTVLADAQVREAAWDEVRAKAIRLRQEGAVLVKDISPDRIYASVRGDHGTYDVMIAKGTDYAPSFGKQGSQSISNWHCACDWGKWAFQRQFKFIGRLCSHGLAAYHEMQSSHLKGDVGNDAARRGNPYRKMAMGGGAFTDARMDWPTKLPQYQIQEMEQRGIQPWDYDYLESLENKLGPRPELQHLGEKLRTQPIGFEPELNHIEDSHEHKMIDVTKDKETNVGRDITADISDYFDDKVTTNADGSKTTNVGDTTTTTTPSNPMDNIAADNADLGGAPSLSTETAPAPMASADNDYKGTVSQGPDPAADIAADNQDGGGYQLDNGVGGAAGSDGLSSAGAPDPYTVQSGDTLSDIAQSNGYGGDYQSLADQNGISNPDLIMPGQQIDFSGMSDGSGSSGGSTGWGMADAGAGSTPSAGGASSLGTSAGGGLSEAPSNIGSSAGQDSSSWFTSARYMFADWSAEEEQAPPAPGTTPAQPAQGAVPSEAADPATAGASVAPAQPAAPAQQATDPLDAGSGAQTGQESSGGGGGFDFMEMAQPFLDAGASALGDIGSSIAGGLGGALGGIFSASTHQGAYPEPGDHQPFNGSGPVDDFDFNSTEDTPDKSSRLQHNKDVTKMHNEDGGKIAAILDTPDPYAHFQVEASGESQADMVRNFQAQNGHVLRESAAPSNEDIATNAARFLRTAGRIYSEAEKAGLENESHPQGARNLASLDLEGTHYIL